MTAPKTDGWLVPAAARIPPPAGVEEVDWQVSAVCATTDPEIFFPEKGGSSKDAKALCVQCPVRAPCLEVALSNDERFGIWGGLSERERRRLNYQRIGRPLTLAMLPDGEIEYDEDEEEHHG